MKKKLFVGFLAVVVLALSLCTVTACDEPASEPQPLKIVYIGDSIAEAVLGPSPLSERDGYGYYALIGRMNGYEYYNRSVSGHKVDQMLTVISKDDLGAQRTYTLLKDADIIHISILGNDFLQNGLDDLIMGAATNNTAVIDQIIEEVTDTFALCIETLRSYNPDAAIFYQNVYNPVYPTSPLISETLRGQLADLATPIVTEADYRALGWTMLSTLGGVAKDYLEDHPNAFYLMDALTEFNNIWLEDAARGKSLIYNDGVHPSNEGHAVLANLTQRKLEELGLADHDKALAAYKEIRIEQLGRLFAESVNVADATAQINACTSGESVTEVYFDLIEGKSPKYC